MGHRKKHAPHRGSLGSRRKRARKHNARWRTWPKSADSAKAKLLGYAGYKAGMTHLAMVNTDRRSPFFKQEQFVPVTVIETPPLVIFSVRTYSIDPLSKKLRVMTQLWGENIEQDLSLRIKVPKRKQNKDQQIANVQKTLDKVKEVRVLAHTVPREAGLPQKTPDILKSL